MILPFAQLNREQERFPLFWLQESFGDLEQSVPYYITGPRGSGKTSLLQALCWEHRLRNETLQAALAELNLAPFDGRFIGIYLSLEQHITMALQGWTGAGNASPEGPEAHGERAARLEAQRFSLWLELVALQKAVAAVIELRLAGELEFPLDRELEVCGRILDNHPVLQHFLLTPGTPQSLPALKQALMRMHDEIYRHATMREPLDEDLFRAQPIGRMLRDIGEHLLSLTPAGTSGHLKVCLDQAECLSPLQQKVINTLVRASRSAVVLVVAFVRKPWDFGPTLIPGAVNTNDDFRILDLGQFYSDHQRFYAFAEGVARGRLQDADREADFTSFCLRHLLGEYDVETFLRYLVSTSDRPELLSLRATEGSLLEACARAVPVPGLDTADAAKNHQLAVLLHFCSKRRLKVPYAGWRVVLALSDRCIRDFLRQMDAIFREVGSVPSGFAAAEVPIEQQSAAIRKASAAKGLDLRRYPLHYPPEVAALVEGTGVLLHEWLKTPAGLADTHRGRVLVRRTGAQVWDRLMRIVDEAELCGFVRVDVRTTEALEFTLHRLFSPKHSLPCRRPRSSLELGDCDLNNLVNKPRAETASEIVRARTRYRALPLWPEAKEPVGLPESPPEDEDEEDLPL